MCPLQPRSEKDVANVELMRRSGTIELAQTLKEVSMKNDPTIDSLASVKTQLKRNLSGLLLGFATLSLALGGVNSIAGAEELSHSPVEGAWLNAVTRIDGCGWRLASDRFE